MYPPCWISYKWFGPKDPGGVPRTSPGGRDALSLSTLQSAVRLRRAAHADMRSKPRGDSCPLLLPRHGRAMERLDKLEVDRLITVPTARGKREIRS